MRKVVFLIAFVFASLLTAQDDGIAYLDAGRDGTEKCYDCVDVLRWHFVFIGPIPVWQSYLDTECAEKPC